MKFLKQQQLSSRNVKDNKVSVGIDGAVKLDSDVRITGDILDRLSVNGDLIVKGASYGTYPLIKNTLYVNADGSDTNDGSALDATKACRTIGGVLKSPLYGPGTSIKVSPGHYLENNPLTLKPFTSIIGSDLRTTAIEPINKTQDIFHMNTSCYIAQLQFLNGRSGIIDPNIDRGAFTIAFPPKLLDSEFKGYITNNLLTVTEVIKGSVELNKLVNSSGLPLNTTIVAFDSGNTSVGTYFVSSPSNSNITFGSPTDIKTMTIAGEKIVLYKSPYVQNCTNQSGPWLYDGTMFIPNQTVQNPKAVGTTTYAPNSDGSGQTSITVAVSEGTVEVGMSINTAPRDQGFFDARTLLLSNKEFIQERVVNYVLETYPLSTYPTEQRRREIGVILEDILYDTTFGGNSKSVESGLYYWNDAVSTLPPGEATITVNTLSYMNTLAQDIIVNTPIVDPVVPNTATSWRYSGSVIIVNSPGHTLKQGDRITVSGTTAASNPPNTSNSAADNFTVFNVTENSFRYLFDKTPSGTAGGTLVYTKVNEYTQYRPLRNGIPLLNGAIAGDAIENNINIVKTIILDIDDTPIIYYSTAPETGLVSAEVLLQYNKTFIQDQTIIELNADPKFPPFVSPAEEEMYKKELGIIIDAVSQDILVGGNSKSIDAGKTYYSANQLILTALEKPKTIKALELTRDTCVKIVTKDPDYPGNPNYQSTRSEITENQIIRNFDYIIKIIQNGLSIIGSLKRHNGTSLFSATGTSSDDVKEATVVTSITPTYTPGTYTIGLNKPTVGIGTGISLYFGYTTVYPAINDDIPDRWRGRRLDPYGSIGGMLVDGGVLSDKSPIKSMVMDAYTQVNQGGRGIRVTNNGYAQLVSVFTIFCSIAVQVDNGGICSITNSNNNFGDLCLVAKGYGKRDFIGTVYNPPAELYPQGKYPTGGNVQIFVPDANYRPHISLIMEVEPPADFINAQGKPGFLTAAIDLSTITEGALEITDVDVSGIAIGQTIYIRDQFGNYADPVTGKSYLTEGTIVSDLGFRSIILSQPVAVTAGNPNIPTYFKLFTAGNAYYTVLSSVKSSEPFKSADNPTGYEIGKILLPSATQGINGTFNQTILEIAALEKLRDLILDEVNSSTHTTITSLFSNTTSILQNYTTVSGYISEDTLTVTDGASSSLLNKLIIGDGVLNTGTKADPFGTRIVATRTDPNSFTINASQNIGSNTKPVSLTAVTVPFLSSRNLTQVQRQDESDAATIIVNNISTFVSEISNWLAEQTDELFIRRIDLEKCERDVALICRCIADDLTGGSNYFSIFAGLSYWGRGGTYHLVQIEEYVADKRLFKNGALVNFYQRSYMSASGYLFEYIGSGSNYGALPQVGRTDPIQNREVTMLDGGKVFFTSTDQNGDFRIGPELVISQSTGTLSGRTFQKSLFAEMTPFILALE